MSTPQPSKEQWNALVIIYAISTVWLYFKYFLSAVYAVNTGNHPAEDMPLLNLPPVPSHILRRERQFANLGIASFPPVPFRVPNERRVEARFKQSTGSGIYRKKVKNY